MKSVFAFVLVLVSSVILMAPAAQAKELASRLGVGYRDALVSFSLPSIATIYYPSSNMGVVGALGVDTQDNQSAFALQAGIRRLIFMEENMNFFMGGNIAMVSQEQTVGVTTDKESGFEISAIVGGEFFLNGLDSLGFNFETGVGVSNLDKVRFRTLGDSMVRAGMIFYF